MMTTIIGITLIILKITVYKLAEAGTATQYTEKSSGLLIIETAKKHLEDLPIAETANASANVQAAIVKDTKMIEFDILLSDKLTPSVHKESTGVRNRRKAVRHEMYRWPGAIVPYEIHESIDEISAMARLKVKTAMEQWEKLTCVKFVPYDASKYSNWLSIRRGQWCASKLGMTGGIQPLYLAGGCLKTGTVVHELGHTLGWVHEQARPDRDEHVDIKWDLISVAYKSQYDKHDNNYIDTFNVPYDYGSIMHYPSYGEIVTRDRTKQEVIGQREKLSFMDIKLANLMYKCAERKKCDTNAIECETGGYIGANCRCTCPDGTESCTVRNDIGGASSPDIAPAPCNEWSTHEQSYIVGHNDDVAFGVTPDECKTRCKGEKAFVCQSFDYWQERKQCYLSAVTRHGGARVQFARDSRMTHFERNVSCSGGTAVVKAAVTKDPSPAGKFSAGMTQKKSSSVVDAARATNPAATVAPTRTSNSKGKAPSAKTCPAEFEAMANACVRGISSPQRPVQIAAIECETKLNASLWTFNASSVNDVWLSNLLDDNEYWIRIDNYKSNNALAGFFEFCPYLAKERGAVLLRDDYCYRKKGFLCAA